MRLLPNYFGQWALVVFRTNTNLKLGHSDPLKLAERHCQYPWLFCQWTSSSVAYIPISLASSRPVISWQSRRVLFTYFINLETCLLIRQRFASVWDQSPVSLTADGMYAIISSVIYTLWLLPTSVASPRSFAEDPFCSGRGFSESRTKPTRTQFPLHIMPQTECPLFCFRQIAKSFQGWKNCFFIERIGF